MAWTEHLTEKRDRGRLPTAGVCCRLNIIYSSPSPRWSPSPHLTHGAPRFQLFRVSQAAQGRVKEKTLVSPLAGSLSIARLGPSASVRLGSDTVCSANLSPLLSLTP